MKPHRLKILYQDDLCVAVHKPAGMTVYAEGPGVPEAKSLVESQLGFPVWPVHRLDKSTCGVLLFAKSGRAASDLRSLLASRKVQKTYLAVVAGSPPAKGSIQTPLTHKGETVSAHTDYRTLQSNGQLSLLELSPRTGRHHQIRKHLKSIGHPIVGDAMYGGPAHGAKRALLCALSLSWPNPRTRARVSVRTQPDSDMKQFIRSQLG